MSVLQRSTNERLKLKKISSNIHFPEDKTSNLPYLGKEITACTTILTADCEHEIERKVEDELTHSNSINWCRTIHNVYPLKVTGQGNQFLQAVSFMLWGLCGAASLLQRLLFVSMSEFAEDKIFERWIRIKNRKETTVELDFKRFVDMARCSSDGEVSSSEIASDEFPHPLHIFIMANIIRRPIVIVGDEREAHTGIYLPVLSKPEDCTKWPLILAVHDGLFFPLVNKECPAGQKKLAEFAIPLVSYELHPVKVVFLSEAEENEVFTLLQKYLNTTELNLTRSSGVSLILSAKLNNMPFEFAGNPLQSVDDKRSSSDPRPVVPSAPSASIVTLNNLSGVSPRIEETTREMSMLQETCRFPGCHLFASRFTDPYCWEHVDQGNSVANQNGSARRSSECVEISLVNERCKEARCPNFASRFIYPYCYEHIDEKTVESIIRSKPMRNELPPECSVVMEYCRHGNCRNYSSQYVYPFCYKHLDDHTAQTGASGYSTARANEPVINREFDMSIMVDLCAHPTCNNHASKYTFPVCYEHLGSPYAITRAASATRVVQLPHAGQRPPTGSANGSQQSVVQKQLAQVQGGIDKKFEETMRELEERTRNGQLCLKPGCNNFGNSRCCGYCHSCYNLQNQF